MRFFSLTIVSAACSASSGSRSFASGCTESIASGCKADCGGMHMQKWGETNIAYLHFLFSRRFFFTYHCYRNLFCFLWIQVNCIRLHWINCIRLQCRLWMNEECIWKNKVRAILHICFHFLFRWRLFSLTIAVEGTPVLPSMSVRRCDGCRRDVTCMLACVAGWLQLEMVRR